MVRAHEREQFAPPPALHTATITLPIVQITYTAVLHIGTSVVITVNADHHPSLCTLIQTLAHGALDSRSYQAHRWHILSQADPVLMLTSRVSVDDRPVCAWTIGFRERRDAVAVRAIHATNGFFILRALGVGGMAMRAPLGDLAAQIL